MASHAELTSYINSLAPTAYWTMTEASGTFAQTGSSTAAALTPSGTVIYQDQELIPGDATRFATFAPGGYANGSRGNITLPVATMSASFIVYYTPPANPSLNLRQLSIGASGETAATNYQLLTQIRSDGRLGDFHETGEGDNVDAITDKTVDPRYTRPVGIPMMFTIARNNTTKITRFYVNGVFFEDVSYTSAPTGGTSTVFVLGHHPTISGASSLQAMSFGHVCFFQRVLSDQEVRDMASAAGLLDVPAGQVRFAAQADEVNSEDALAVKTMLCAVDPLIDISVAFPSDAYTTQE